jgi:hypothetical protein
VERPEPEITRHGRLLLACGLLAVAAACVLHSLSSVARSLAAGETVYIAVFPGPASDPLLPASLISFHPASRTVDIAGVPAGALKLSGSNQQKARMIRSFFIPASSFTQENVSYAVLPPAAPGTEDEEFYRWEKARQWLNGWRSNPFRLKAFAVFLHGLYSRELTNISLHDALLLSLEFSSLSVSDFKIAGYGDTGSGRRPGTGRNKPGMLSGLMTDHSGETAPDEETKIITAEVLNASGKAGLALDAARFLREKGVDVVNFNNYSSIEPRTAVVDRSGRVSASRQVRSLLGLSSMEIRSELDKSRLIDVTVIMGRDFSLPEK